MFGVAGGAACWVLAAGADWVAGAACVADDCCELVLLFWARAAEVINAPAMKKCMVRLETLRIIRLSHVVGSSQSTRPPDRAKSDPTECYPGWNLPFTRL